MKRRTIIGLVLAAAWGAGAADPAPVYTLEDCLREGLAQSAEAKNARADRAIADAVARQLGSEAWPHLSVNGQYDRADKLPTIEFENQSFELGVLNTYAAQAEVSQLLYSAGRMRAALEAAGINRSYADWLLKEQEREIVRNIRLGFNRVLLNRAALEVSKASVRQLEAVLKQTEDRNRGGAASDFDVLSARVRLENERPELLRAENDAALALEFLRRLVRLDGAPFDIKGELTVEERNPDIETLSTRALERRAAVRAQEEIVALRERDVIVERSRRLPELKAVGAYRGANTYGFAPSEEAWEWHWSAGLAASWNFWDGGLTSGKIEQKRQELGKARTDLENLRGTIRLQVRQTCLELQQAAKTMASGRETIALAERALEIARVRYDAELATRLELTDASLAKRDAELLWFRAKHDYESAMIRLEYVTGLERSEF